MPDFLGIPAKHCADPIFSKDDCLLTVFSHKEALQLVKMFRAVNLRGEPCIMKKHVPT